MSKPELEALAILLDKSIRFSRKANKHVELSSSWLISQLLIQRRSLSRENFPNLPSINFYKPAMAFLVSGSILLSREARSPLGVVESALTGGFDRTRFRTSCFDIHVRRRSSCRLHKCYRMLVDQLSTCWRPKAR